ncbi:putative transposable element [Trichonephila clavipes]|nr:putative transposable element [Trichonephila clavipes]
MATHTSRDEGKSNLGRNEIRTRRVYFKLSHMQLSSSRSTAKPSKSTFISVTACPKQTAPRRFLSYHSINGDRYRAMITNFFIPELNNHDVQELWFQQDGATCHTARATIDLLKDKFGEHLISRFGAVNWPPRSCDLCG